MTKSPDAFRTISEVAEALDVPAHVLRFWETRFAQVKPVKRGGGRRYYRPDDVRLLRGIRGLLYDDGMTIKGVQKILREQGVRHVIGLGTTDEAAPPAPPAPPRAAGRARAAVPRPPAPAAPAAANSHRPAEPDARQLAAAQAAPSPGAQPDLFTPAAAGAADQATAPKPLDRAALRRLVGELESLRGRMVAGRAD
jgi:DNA-binding transcriptional MerR regulator